MMIESRKKDHVDIVVEKGAQYHKSAGFDAIAFVHNALPEIDFEKIDLSTSFLGKKIKWPLLITGMTGGYKEAGEINRRLAACAEKFGIALGLGSQRAMVENEALKSTYYVREEAPTIPLLANIGAYQLKKYPLETVERLVSAVEADGLAIHLNPLQEIVQPEGDRDYSGVLKAIERVCERIERVVVKETGAGICREVAEKLKAAGVEWIDVSGAGGTSWSKVERMRGGLKGFDEWGLPTVMAIKECKGIAKLIGSGGVRNGIDAAKAIALGCEMAGSAYPFIKAEREGRLEEFTAEFLKQMKVCAYLTGSDSLEKLKKAPLYWVFSLTRL